MATYTPQAADLGHQNVIEWAKKLIARASRGEKVGKDSLKLAKKVMALRDADRTNEAH